MLVRQPRDGSVAGAEDQRSDVGEVRHVADDLVAGADDGNFTSLLTLK